MTSSLGSSFGEILTAAVTPFRSDTSLDQQRFASLCHHLLSHGSDGLIVAGTTGEGPTLEDDEKIELFEIAADVARQASANILGCIGSPSTAHAVKLTERAGSTGIDGLLVVVPYYNRPPMRGIIRHFEAVAAATSLPIMIYNIPRRTGVTLDRDTIAGLAAIGGITAIKQSDPDIELARFICDETSLHLYAGNDDLLLPFLQLGGVGGVFVVSHLVGEELKAICSYIHVGDLATAEAVYAKIRLAVEAVETVANPTAVKAALNLIGIEVGPPRLPLVAPTASELERIDALLTAAGIKRETTV